MAITLVGTPQSTGLINGANAPILAPSGWVAGDTMYIFGAIFGRALSTFGPTGGTFSGGWSTLTTDVSTTFVWFGAWRRRLQAADSFTSFVGSGSASAQDPTCYGAICLRGVDATTPEDVALTSANGNSSLAAVNAPSITPASNGCCILIAGGGSFNTSKGTVANYILSTGANATDTNSVSLEFGRRMMSTGKNVAEDPASWSTWTTAGYWRAITIAARPDFTESLGDDLIYRPGGEAWSW